MWHQVISCNEFCLGWAPGVQFFFIDVKMKDPFTSEAVPPVWLLVSGWTPKEPSTHHWKMLVESEFKIRGRVGVERKYLIKRTRLVQSSSSGKNTLVVRNVTAVWMSGRARLVANRARAVKVWKTCANISRSFFWSYWTLNRLCLMQVYVCSFYTGCIVWSLWSCHGYSCTSWISFRLRLSSLISSRGIRGLFRGWASLI